MSKVYQGSIGIAVQVLTDAVLTGATSISLKIKKPSGAMAAWAATIDGINPKQLDYTTVANDLNEQGEYYLQPSVVLGTQTLLGETVRFPIYAPFQ
jgi:hypothetical protein